MAFYQNRSAFGQSKGDHPLVLTGSGNPKRFAPTNIFFDKENDTAGDYRSHAKDSKQSVPDSRRTLVPDYDTNQPKHSTGKGRVDPGSYSLNPSASSQGFNRPLSKNAETHGTYGGPQNEPVKQNRFTPLESRLNVERNAYDTTSKGQQRRQSPVKQQKLSPERQRRQSPVRQSSRQEYKEVQKPQTQQAVHTSFKHKYDVYSSIACLPGAFNSREDPGQQQHFSRKIGPKEHVTRDIIGADRNLGDADPEQMKRHIPPTKALKNQESDNYFEAKDRVDPLAKHRNFHENRGKLLAQSEDEYFVLSGHHPKQKTANSSSHNIFKSSLQHLG